MTILLLPYLCAFALSLALALALTPAVRELHRKWGLVDKPDPRRINKVPIPRGGGMAIVAAVVAGYCIVSLTDGFGFLPLPSGGCYPKVMLLSVAVALLGLADDKYSLSPKAKLAGQLAVAFLVWWWAGLGFRQLWPSLPPWLDAAMTVFWIAGAINAFNLIDGLDGLASGIALIAVTGMAGSCILIRNPQAVIFYVVFAGALVGFLRYNFCPATVFLGDSGSMFIGFMLSALPLASQTSNSFLVSVGVPLLAMGVPVFDTMLAIVRRVIRRKLSGGGGADSGKVMSADTDHLHHRILRMCKLDQRKAALILYGATLALVAVGLVSILLKSRTVGLWLGTVMLVSCVIFKDATIELFDAGHLLNNFMRSHDSHLRRRLSFVSTPFFIVADAAVMALTYSVCDWMLDLPQSNQAFRTCLLIRFASVFAFLVWFKTYRTVWSRAVTSNFLRLALACAFGSVCGSVIIYYYPTIASAEIIGMTVCFAALSAAGLITVRILRSVIRETFYTVDCGRIANRKDVSRVLVYGAGLRYRIFRRELMRSAFNNKRVVVGIVDDDPMLRGRYIGGMKIYGSFAEIAEIVNAANADAVVVTCEIPEEDLLRVRETLAPMGVKVTQFGLKERTI